MKSMKQTKVSARAGRLLKVLKAPGRCKVTRARFDIFTRGQIWGMYLAGAKHEDIRRAVVKKDGAVPRVAAIAKVIEKKKAEPEWQGEESENRGRPEVLSGKMKKDLVKLVFKARGSVKVTIAYCKKQLPALKKVDDTVVARALHAAGLKWLCRRKKRWVPPKSKESRLEFCEWIMKRHQSTLDRFAYTDGTTFYLARGPAESDDKKRVALGSMVWRMSTGGDGLYDDNISPSLYSKSQGLPVKIWGFFANGVLDYWVLPKDEERTTHMTGDTYEWLVGAKFKAWRTAAFQDDRPVHLVQDHERCLWQQRNIDALRQAGCHVIMNYPKHSPDLNAIEGHA